MHLFQRLQQSSAQDVLEELNLERRIDCIPKNRSCNYEIQVSQRCNGKINAGDGVFLILPKAIF